MHLTTQAIVSESAGTASTQYDMAIHDETETVLTQLPDGCKLTQIGEDERAAPKCTVCALYFHFECFANIAQNAFARMKTK